MKLRNTVLALVVVPLAVAACGGEDKPDTPDPDPIEILTKTLPDVALGAAFDEKIEVKGGVPPYTFSVTAGALPAGLELQALAGQIVGMAGAPGAHNFTVNVGDSAGASKTQVFDLYVTPDPLVIETTVLPEGEEESPYDALITVSGGVEPYGFALASGGLPSGLSLDDATGAIAGTPTDAGVFEITIEVKDDEDKSAEATFTLVIAALQPMITTSTVPRGSFGHGYALSFEADGGQPPYTWAVVGGGLPLGLTLASDGRLAGTPLDSGAFMFAVEVSDARSRTDLAMFTLDIIPPLVIETTALPQILATRPTNIQLEASGGLPPYSWSISSGLLPTGLSLSADGVISGQTDDARLFQLTISVQDQQGDQRAAMFDLFVNDRFVYTASPELAFPATCTSTMSSSYATLEIEVTDSMMIDDINVEVDVSYTDPRARAGQRNEHLKLAIESPDGTRATLCGNAAGIRGASGCRGSGGVQTSFDDLSAATTNLDAFKGKNPLGTWRFFAIIARGPFGAENCAQSGTIHRVDLKIRDDRSPDPYVKVVGYHTNNLVTDPWVRIVFFNAIPENELFLSATLYDAGPNMIREGGAGDDVPDTTREFTWAIDGAAPPPFRLTPDGRITAGEFTGEGDVIATDGQGTEVRQHVLVVPPDWNPLVRQF